MENSKSTKIRISAKNLGELALPSFCPRCFWLKLRLNNKLPFQIFPGIFSSIDAYTKNIVQTYFDANGKFPDWMGGLGEKNGYSPVSALALIYMEPVTHNDAVIDKKNHCEDGFAMGFSALINPLEKSTAIIP